MLKNDFFSKILLTHGVRVKSIHFHPKKMWNMWKMWLRRTKVQCAAYQGSPLLLPFTTRVLRWLISCVHILVDFNLIDVSSNHTIWKIFLVYYVDVVPFQENPVHSCWLLLFSLLVQSCCLLLILFWFYICWCYILI